MIETPDWMTDALCRGKNSNVWFPPFETASPELHYAVARIVCHVCPVWDDCLSMGLKETYGMWGGLTPQERTPLQKESRTTHLAEHGTVTRYRQGCHCDECDTANALRPMLSEVDMSLIPNAGEEIPADLKSLLEGLLRT